MKKLIPLLIIAGCSSKPKHLEPFAENGRWFNVEYRGYGKDSVWCMDKRTIINGNSTGRWYIGKAADSFWKAKHKMK